MMRSLRSRLVLSSLLWSAGLLGLMHGISIYLVTSRFQNLSLFLLFSGIAMIAGFFAGWLSLMPFTHLRQCLASVRKGERARVEGSYPSEIQPVIDDLNALLEDREKAVKRAFSAAGDLAHGLKTPLAVLAQESEKNEAVAQQVERMNRQVTYHLARARAAASGAGGAAPCPLAPCVAAIVRTLAKLNASRVLRFEANVADNISVRAQVQDLEEILGNVLDNAYKWAHSRITVEASHEGNRVRIEIDDDGPGLAAPLRTAVLERGVRADEATPGWGLGLAIVRDLVEIYGGAVALLESPLGGLRVRLHLPA